MNAGAEDRVAVVKGVRFCRWRTIAPAGSIGSTSWLRFTWWSFVACGYVLAFSLGYLHWMIARPALANTLAGIGLGVVPLVALVAAAFGGLRSGPDIETTLEPAKRPSGVPQRAVSVAVGLSGSNVGTGSDWGWLWEERGRLIFEGENCVFRLKRADFKTKKELASAWSASSSLFLRTPRGYPMTMRVLPVRLAAGEPRYYDGGVEEFRAVLRGFESQPLPAEESLFPPIERDREAMPMRRLTVPVLMLLPAGIPLAATLLVLSTMLPQENASRLRSPAGLIGIVLPLPLILGLSIVQVAVTGRAYDSSIRKAIAKEARR